MAEAGHHKHPYNCFKCLTVRRHAATVKCVAPPFAQPLHGIPTCSAVAWGSACTMEELLLVAAFAQPVHVVSPNFINRHRQKGCMALAFL